ncbi:MAG: hypothetical protein ACREQ5_29170 [Candidatus Dormibacteria bacterium]
MKYVALNFTGAEKLTVEPVDYTSNPGIGKRLVSLQARGGGLSMLFAMTPEQARNFGCAVIAAADSFQEEGEYHEM